MAKSALGFHYNHVSDLQTPIRLKENRLYLHYIPRKHITPFNDMENSDKMLNCMSCRAIIIN